jgi:predicted ATPase
MLISILATSLFAIIGGPSVGKTSIINALQEEGHITCRETATDISLEEQSKGCLAPWNESGFERKVFDEKLHRELHATKLAKEQNKPTIFVDRGLLDQLVYLEVLNKQETDEAKYIQNKLKELDCSSRYKAIFYVEPHSGSDFQFTASNVRCEDTQRALLIAEKLKAVYTETGLPIITVPPNLTPKERAQFILAKVNDFQPEKGVK